MLPALRNLGTAKAEGLLDALEYGEAKGKILAGQLGNWADSPATGDALQLAASIDSLAKTVDDLTHCLPQVPGAGPVKQRAPERRVAAEAGTPGTKRFRPEGEMEVHPAAREPDQPSLLAQGVTANTTVRGRVFRLTEATLKPRRLMYRCSYAGCNREFKNPAGRGKHEKSHRGGEKKPATLTAMRAIRASLSAAQLKATVEIDIKHAILGCISDAASTAKVKGGWAAKVDGCKKNKGSTVRHFRSWAFKKKVIVAYENLEELSSFAFSLADAQRDIKTGEMPAAPAPQVAVPAQDTSEDDEADPEELSENEGSDSDGGRQPMPNWKAPTSRPLRELRSTRAPLMT